MSSVVLTQPTTDATEPSVSLDVAVPYNTSTTLDQCQCMLVKWLYKFVDNTDGTAISGEVHAHLINTEVRWTWYNIVGDVDTMKHSITVQRSTNPESIDIIVYNNDSNGQDWIADIIRMHSI